MAVTPGFVGSGTTLTWSASTTASAAAVSIGTATLDRVVVIAATIEETALINNITIDGVAMTQGISVRNVTGTPDNAAAIFYLPWPTGTTATFVVTLSASSSLTGRISIWAMTGAYVPHVATNSAQGAGTTQTLSGLTIPTNGCAIYAFNNATAGTATVWTNATGRDDLAMATYRHSGADTTTAGTPTVTADAATANQILAGIVFAPLPPQGWDQTPEFRGMPRRPKTAALALMASGAVMAPYPVPSAPDATPVFTVTTAQVFNTTLNYQDIAFCPTISAAASNTTCTVWPLTFGDKARSLSRPAPQGTHLFVPKEAVVENTTSLVWPLTQGDKAHPLPRVAPPGLWAFGYPYLGIDNTTTIEKWQQPLSRAVPIPRPAPVGGEPFVPHEATIDNTTTTVWPLTFGEKARPLSRVAPPGTWAFGTPQIILNTIVGIGWHQPFPVALNLGWPRHNPRYGGQPFIPKAATVDNTIRGIAWQEAWKGPPRIRPRPERLTHTTIRFAPPTVVVDGMAWHVQWPGPGPRSRIARPFVQNQAIARIAFSVSQVIFAEIETAVDIHICGWGTETEDTDGFIVQAETSDQWSEQVESTDEYDEQDECGR